MSRWRARLVDRVRRIIQGRTPGMGAQRLVFALYVGVPAVGIVLCLWAGCTRQ